MGTQTAYSAKMFGADSRCIVNEQKTCLLLPKTVKLAKKFAANDRISMMQYCVNLPQLSLSPTRKVFHCHSLLQSEVGVGAETTELYKSVCVKFQLEKECQFGDQILLVGDDPILGSWNPSDAIPFDWSEGHIWSLFLELPVGKPIQYKVLLKNSMGEVMWQPGPDRNFEAWETKNVITVTEEWDNAEAHKISEEQQAIEENEELMRNTLEEPSLPDSDRKAPRKEVAVGEGFERQAKADKNSAELGEEGNLVPLDTVEEFWCLYDQIFKPSKLVGNADFHLFKNGIEPKWEDPECAHGGKWTVSANRKTNLEGMWLETLMALIGEQFDEADEICGVVASARSRGDKLSLWTRNAANESVQMGIGRKWKDIIDITDKINYSFHDDAKKDNKSNRGRYSV